MIADPPGTLEPNLMAGVMGMFITSSRLAPNSIADYLPLAALENQKHELRRQVLST